MVKYSQIFYIIGNTNFLKTSIHKNILLEIKLNVFDNNWGAKNIAKGGIRHEKKKEEEKQ